MNDEIPANTAFFGQAAPDTGEAEGGVVGRHQGFDHPREGGILASEMFEAADFTARGYPIAKFSFMAVNAITDDRSYSAELGGDQEVPPVTTAASGSASIDLVEGGTKLEYTIATIGLSNVVAAHFHLAPAGENGGVVAFLFGPVAAGGGVLGEAITGELTSADLVGELAGFPLDVLVEEIEAGNIYINIHTNDGIEPTNTGEGDQASGEIRGQLGPSEQGE